MWECQFGGQANQRWISDEQRMLVERLLLERISLRGSCRAVGLKWLLGFLAECSAQAPKDLPVHMPTQLAGVVLYRLEGEADETYSFVGKQANRPWIWIALDATTRQVIAFQVGDRSRQSAKQLWQNIPAVYRHHATFHTDLYAISPGVIPPAQHRVISKQARRTNHIEGFTAPYANGCPGWDAHVIVLQETGQSYRCHPLLPLSLQPDESCSITWRALPKLESRFFSKR